MNLLFIVILSCFLINTNAQLRINNGAPSSITDNPYLVAIKYDCTYGCAGSLVTWQIVATIEKCVKKSSVEKMSVEAGVTKLNETPPQTRNVKKVYSSNTLNVGVIKLSEAFDTRMGSKVNIIPLCTKPLPDGKLMRVNGWANHVEPLQTVYVAIVTRQECLRRFEGTKAIVKNSMICGLNSYNVVSSEDAGAPAAVDGELCAMVIGDGADSDERAKADVAYPQLYTDVYNKDVRRFIQSKMKC